MCIRDRGSTNQSANGLYEFLAVPLSPGMNVVRVVTYGPRGERTESVRVINVGAGLLHRGEATFQFGAVQQNETLFHIGAPTAPPDGSPVTSTTQGRPRIIGQMNYGITELLTGSAGLALIPSVAHGNMGVYNVGLRTSLLGLATEVEAAGDTKGGMAASIGVAGAFHGVSGVFRQAEYRNGFVDENALGASPSGLRARTELTLDSSLNLRGRMIPFSLRVLRNGYADGTDDLSGTARVSTTLAGLLLSAGVDYSRPVAGSSTLTGYLTAATFKAYSWQLRMGLDYQLAPTVQGRLLSFSADHAISDKWALHFSVGEPLDQLSGVSVSVSAVTQRRYGDFSFIGEYDNQLHSWRLSTEWSFGLGYNPSSHHYELQRSGPGSGGSLLLDAFVDENGNGIRDPGEEGVSKVDVELGSKKVETGPDGRILVYGAGSGPTGAARVTLDSIDNPSVSSPPSNVQFPARPGSVTRIPYPLQPTGDVGVHVDLVRDDGRTVGLSATHVQLIPDRGGAAIDGMTEFDGSVVFSQVPAGRYKVVLAPDQAARLKMHALSEVSVTIKTDGSFSNDVVMQVKFDTPPDQNGTSAAGG